MSKIIDLSILLEYYEKLAEIIDRIYPAHIPDDEIMNYNFTLDYTHPPWVKRHFPLVLIYHRNKAGKLRDSKKLSIIFQNNHNVATQLVWTADSLGFYLRKNKSKGFKKIVAAIQADLNIDSESEWADREPLKKYKNFIEMWQMTAPDSIEVRALCEVLQENYPCDSHGQLRML